MPAVISTSSKIEELSGEVTDRSKAAGFPMTQLGNRVSGGREWLWSGVRLFPTSTQTPR